MMNQHDQFARESSPNLFRPARWRRLEAIVDYVAGGLIGAAFVVTIVFWLS